MRRAPILWQRWAIEEAADDALSVGDMTTTAVSKAVSEDNPAMLIGDRLRAFREAKKLSQGDIEERTGLLRSYFSRVENGHTVPAIETLEKMARALEVPLYQLLYDGEEPPLLPNLPKSRTAADIAWGSSGKDGRYLMKFRQNLSRMRESDRRLILFMAQKMARQSSARPRGRS